MKFNITNLIICFGLFATLMVPINAYAQSLQFENPLRWAATMPAKEIGGAIITKIIMLLVSIAAPLALLAITISGIRLITVPFLGEKEVVKAKQVLFWAILGLLIIGMSSLILLGIQYALYPNIVSPIL